MIQLEPSEPTNYFALAKIYEDAGAYDEAEKMLVSRRRTPSRPTRRSIWTLAGYYNRQGHFDKTIEALEGARREGTEQPGSVLHDRPPTTGTRPTATSRLKDAEKKDFVAQGHDGGGPRAAAQARLRRGDFYKGLLLRLQANLEKDPAKQQQLLKDATALERGRRTRCARRRPPAPRPSRATTAIPRSTPTIDWINEGRQGQPDGLFV